jgi:hypothetical protein
MWLAMLIFCVDVNAASCQFSANVDQLHMSEEACIEDVMSAAANLTRNLKPAYIAPACLALGASV